MSKQLANNLFHRIADLIESSRKNIVSAVNFTMVYTYFEIGKMIVEEEQQGNKRAEYAKSVLKELSVKLSEKFGRGFSETNLRNMRKFYIIYSQTQIQQKASAELQNTENKNDIIWQNHSAKFPSLALSWSHYLILMRIENPEERKFYEIEAVNYYDRYVKLPHEKPTIGILLCKEKKDTLVKLTLPKDVNIYASEYSPVFRIGAP